MLSEFRNAQGCAVLNSSGDQLSTKSCPSEVSSRYACAPVKGLPCICVLQADAHAVVVCIDALPGVSKVMVAQLMTDRAELTPGLPVPESLS